MRKYHYKITVSYNGARYFGWQKQKDFPTIQGEIEKVFNKICKKPFQTLGASRTDARVHALGNVFKAMLQEPFELTDLKTQLNNNLPPDIRIKEVEKSRAGFKVIHFSDYKEYFYQFSNLQEHSPFNAPFVVNVDEELDIELMRKACKLFIGEHDFQNYQLKGSQTKTTVRTIFECEIHENLDMFGSKAFSPYFTLRIRGTGFLKQMIRLIMGTLWCVGMKQISLDDVKESLAEGSTKKVGFAVPASGLFLHYVHYPNSNREENN